MLRFDVSELKALRAKLARELTFTRFFRVFDIRPAQQLHAFAEGFGLGRTLKAATIAARAMREGYYRRRRLPKVADSRPFGVWAGVALRATYSEKKVTTRSLTYTFSLQRWWMRQPWSKKLVEAELLTQAEAYFEKRFAREIA